MEFSLQLREHTKANIRIEPDLHQLERWLPIIKRLGWKTIPQSFAATDPPDFDDLRLDLQLVQLLFRVQPISSCSDHDCGVFTSEYQAGLDRMTGDATSPRQARDGFVWQRRCGICLFFQDSGSALRMMTSTLPLRNLPSSCLFIEFCKSFPNSRRFRFH